MNLIRFIAVAVVAAVSSCPAQTASSRTSAKTVVWSPPRTGWWDNMPKPTVPNEMIGALRVADFPITLEKTKLEDMHKRFGGTIGDRGDAGDAEAWLCLFGSDSERRWIIWLTSGEIDGPAIGGFQWRLLSLNETPDRRCSPLPEKKGGIKLPIALHPGMTEAEVQLILGRPTATRGKTLFFRHEHQETIRKEQFTASNGVAIVIREGVVWAIEVAETTSN